MGAKEGASKESAPGVDAGLSYASVSQKELTDDEGEERPEYASHPREFTKSGTPIPFWQMEMKKGTEYILSLHRKYGKREKHERVAAYKPDLEVISVDTKDSFDDIVNFPSLYDQTLLHLVPVDRLFLFHRQDVVHGIFACMTKTLNNYCITNHHGHLLYKVNEIKKCLSSKRTFFFKDFNGKAALKIAPCCVCLEARRKFKVYCPPENLVGFVMQSFPCHLQEHIFSIRDENYTEIIQFQKISQRIKVRNNPDLIFEYKSVRGQGPLGRITTKLADLKLVNFTEHDYYGIKIIDSLSPNIKVKIMAAWFIIYQIYYKEKTHRDIHHNLTKPAKRLFEDRKPSTEEIPQTEEGNIAYM